MVVTSKLLAAHTSGSPLDVSSKFWTNYYRSLKDVRTDDTNHRASTDTRLSRDGTTSPPFAPISNHSVWPSTRSHKTTTTYVTHTYRLWIEDVSADVISSETNDWLQTASPRNLFIHQSGNIKQGSFPSRQKISSLIKQPVNVLYLCNFFVLIGFILLDSGII